jgi:hypothetical protein
MSYASRAGRARTNPSAPQAHAICDRCGCRYNFVDLQWQMEWRGATLQNIRILVCRTCLDRPQENIRSIVVPADPMPIINARVQDFAAAETDYRTAAAIPVNDPVTGIPVPPSVQIVTPAGQSITTSPTGSPPGIAAAGVMPLQQGVHYGVSLPLTSVTTDGATVSVRVTTPTPHGLATGAQVVVDGMTKPQANGGFNVTVVTATLFTYDIQPVLPAQSLLQSGARIVTANVGVPLNYSQIPQIGG